MEQQVNIFKYLVVVAAISYHSFADPLFKNLFLDYLIQWKRSGSQKPRKIFIYTFEQSTFSLTDEEVETWKSKLSKESIFWRPVRYTPYARYGLISKLADALSILPHLWRLKRKEDLKSIIGFTTLSCIMAYYYSKVLVIRNILLNVEPHSQYLLETGQLVPNSLAYRLLRKLESIIIRKGDAVSVPTHRAYKKYGKKYSNVYCLPTSIRIFDINTADQKDLREDLEVGDRRLIVYVGKFGGIYYDSKSFAQLVKPLADMEQELFILIITSDSTEDIHETFDRTLATSNWKIVKSVPFEQLPSYLSQCDFGLLFLPPYPSQRYRCPVKTATYWAAGIPIIINHGISDDYIICRREKAGIVISDPENITYEELELILGNDFDSLDCQDVASKYRSLKHTIAFLDKSAA